MFLGYELQKRGKWNRKRDAWISDGGDDAAGNAVGGEEKVKIFLILHIRERISEVDGGVKVDSIGGEVWKKSC